MVGGHLTVLNVLLVLGTVTDTANRWLAHDRETGQDTNLCALVVGQREGKDG